jgi:hypothetical protein
MKVFEQAIGVGIMLVLLADIFVAVLYARADAGLLAPRVARVVWRVFRGVGGWLDRPAEVLSLCGPAIRRAPRIGGAPGRTRTADAGLRTASLCPLSYGGVGPSYRDLCGRPRLGILSAIATTAGSARRRGRLQSTSDCIDH